MSDRQPVQWIEIDVDVCTRIFGQGVCTAALSASVPSKCFNGTATCSAREALNLGVMTLRFIEARANLPKGATWFPCLQSVSGSSSTVNIAGANDDLAPLGKRATISAKLSDFPYHDRLTDKYAAERVSGAAQFDGVGYHPEDYGTFFTRLRARWPFYAGRPIRHCLGHLDSGSLVTAFTRHFIITDMLVDADGGVTVEGKDILDLADDKRVQAPKAANGSLLADIDISAASLTLTPAGIGNLEYPASGFACIGSELVQFTRAADVVTILARGVSGTTAASHSAGDSFQPSFSLRRQRIDAAVRSLLADYAGINPAFIPWAAWQAEVQRWAPTVRLTTDITKPEGVAKLIGELAVLGVSIWWDDRAQQIGLKMNRPPDTDLVTTLSDRNSLLSLEIEDRDEDRLTTVQFFTVMTDVTKSATDGNSYARQRYIVDAGAISAQEYGDSRVKQIYCRWLNHGDDAAVRVLGRRFLQRFRRQPVRYSMRVDAKDDRALTDVVILRSRDIADATGRPVDQLAQIISREDVVTGNTVDLEAQAFRFDRLYAYFTENTRPTFLASTPAQKARGAYWAGADGKMSDGSDSYRFS